MNVTDTCCQEVNTQISDRLTLLRISALAHTDNAVFLTTDGTNFCLDRKSLAVA